MEELDAEQGVDGECLSGSTQTATALDALTEAELLDHAEAVARSQRECEAQILRIAVRHAIIDTPPGIYVRRGPHGATYLVDHTGTRRVSTTMGSTSRATIHRTRALVELAA